MSHSSKILVVDDEPLGRQLLEAILYPENFDIYYAENGMEAFEKALEQKPDLILMDVMMPEMDGFEVCRKLRNHEILGNIPIILITALDDRDSMIKGLDSGANDYISKPFDRIEVLAKVKNIIQLERYKRMHQESGKLGVREKRTAKPDISFHYAAMIQKSLLPSTEHINNILPQHFIITRPLETMSGITCSISERNDNIIIVLCVKKLLQDISDVLMNIMGVTLINKIAFESDRLNAGKMLDNLRIIILDNAINKDDGFHAINDLDIALCIINKTSLKIQYAGFNMPLFVISDKGLKRIEPDSIYDNARNQANYKNIEVSAARNDSFYIFSNNLLRYFEEDYREPASEDFITLLGEQESKDMKEQEIFFNRLIDNAASGDKKLEDIILIGVRV
jgi:sigma-B regulation protein RsbU (phosphoserine phosphatase)